ncbi:copper oxidase [Brevibacillus agri]|uniref:Copper-containing nitrite reductase n=1 Tax=Brevibacillus agri TaxID=51101 RepID=A0A3M8AA20_9BACL|nr:MULTISPECIES: multicopper oxidase family protein [Brevibacillus]ELK42526.1 multicopper oxidase [Brevibacillus agri BAB-2500]EJL42928.1 putative multicopper oxidase [Brevibacillus sp. CF112]MCG5252143.1 multicopper oxidase family protein [Brevibacillus agri]MDN4091234.1 multicopper oxidase family protein [Brevibacillus agri]MED1646369.1 multicopper oxidase family protein [Brevibacillus agri]
MNKSSLRSTAFPLLLGGLLLLSACSTEQATTAGHAGHDMGADQSATQQPAAPSQPMTASGDNAMEVLTGNTFTLTAKESMLHLDDQTMKTAWTYNGTVPGPQLRVKQGETISVTLKNELPEPVTIHWHGLPVPNNMDGIPGVTQNAVKPNESFTYRFKVDVAGTYWYHSHQNSSRQVDKGLYGSLVVEPKTPEPADKDVTLVLDEWMQDDSMAEMHGGGGSMAGMNHGADHAAPATSAASGHDMANMSDAKMMPLMYTIFSVNGKTGPAIAPLRVKEGEKVRIRLINAGYLSHKLNLQGHAFQIVSTDGQPLHNPPLTSGQLLNIAPGERYDLEFVANNPGTWLLEERSDNPGAKSLAVPIVYEGYEAAQAKPESGQLPVIDLTRYGEAAQSSFSLEQPYDITYRMDLNTDSRDGQMVFTINGQTFPNVPPLDVKKGDRVKVTIVNNSPEDVHPMHLHGHFFQVLSKNGQPVSGSPLVKDTLNVLPGESYVVAFAADNPGEWMFHCHDLGHAAKGMVSEVKYAGFQRDFVVDPTVGNMPE